MADSYSANFLLQTFVFLVFIGFSTLVNAVTVQSTVLVFARDTGSAATVISGFQGYGIPYSVVAVPSTGITLPDLSTNGAGNYGAIVVLGEVSYSYSSGWNSALTADQWNQLYAYQVQYGVRMVRLDVYPGPSFGNYPLALSPRCWERMIHEALRYHDRNPRSWVLRLGGGAVNLDLELIGLPNSQLTCVSSCFPQATQ